MSKKDKIFTVLQTPVTVEKTKNWMDISLYGVNGSVYLNIWKEEGAEASKIDREHIKELKKLIKVLEGAIKFIEGDA